MIFSTKIKIPELILDREKVGKNELIQLAQKEEVIDIDVFNYRNNTFLLQDKLRRQFYLKISGDTQNLRNKNILKARGISNVNELNEQTTLLWVKHIAQDVKGKPFEINNSWGSKFYFKQESENEPGLRNAQLGAVHSVASCS